MNEQGVKQFSDLFLVCKVQCSLERDPSKLLDIAV